jgi:hypothetical protein
MSAFSLSMLQSGVSGEALGVVRRGTPARSRRASLSVVNGFAIFSSARRRCFSRMRSIVLESRLLLIQTERHLRHPPRVLDSQQSCIERVRSCISTRYRTQQRSFRAENGPPSRGLTVLLRNWIQIQFKSTHTKA